jgi:hypothetical protein
MMVRDPPRAERPPYETQSTRSLAESLQDSPARRRPDLRRTPPSRKDSLQVSFAGLQDRSHRYAVRCYQGPMLARARTRSLWPLSAKSRRLARRDCRSALARKLPRNIDSLEVELSGTMIREGGSNEAVEVFGAADRWGAQAGGSRGGGELYRLEKPARGQCSTEGRRRIGLRALSRSVP